MEYKLYLVDRDDHFQAAAAFVAADDMEAVEIAASVQSTCSDVARGYEVWRGTERLAKVRPRSSAYQDMILDELAMKRHDKVRGRAPICGEAEVFLRQPLNWAPVRFLDRGERTLRYGPPARQRRRSGTASAAVSATTQIRLPLQETTNSASVVPTGPSSGPKTTARFRR